MSLMEDARLAQRHDALVRANHKRVTRAFYKKCVLDGRVNARDLVLDPPVELHGMTLLAVLSMTKAKRMNCGVWSEKLGKAALRVGVNLLVPVERASTASREWAADHVAPVHGQTGQRRG